MCRWSGSKGTLLTVASASTAHPLTISVVVRKTMQSLKHCLHVSRLCKWKFQDSYLCAPHWSITTFVINVVSRRSSMGMHCRSTMDPGGAQSFFGRPQKVWQRQLAAHQSPLCALTHLHSGKHCQVVCRNPDCGCASFQSSQVMTARQDHVEALQLLRIKSRGLNLHVH